jgi:hypothetical protein
LQDLIKEAQVEAEKGGESAFSPRTTSLTVQRVANKKEGASERFFHKLEDEVRASPELAATALQLAHGVPQ